MFKHLKNITPLGWSHIMDCKYICQNRQNQLCIKNMNYPIILPLIDDQKFNLDR